MTVRPTLSVMMPNYNHAQYVAGALDAIFAQSYVPLEVIVLDDCSTDDSREILTSYAAREPRLRLVFNERNGGVNAGLKKLVGMAKGTHVFLPAADDLILPGFLEASMALIERHPAAGVCTTATLIIDDSGRTVGALGPDWLRRGDPVYISPVRARALLLERGSWMFGNTAIFRREALNEIGGHRPELASYADGFAHEILARRYGACYVPRALAAWRRLPVTYSTTANRDKAAAARMRDTAVALMRGEFAELFDERYVRRWLDRWRFGLIRQTARDEGAALSEWLDLVLDPASRATRMAILAASHIGPAAVIAAAAMSLRPVDLFLSAWTRLHRPSLG